MKQTEQYSLNQWELSDQVLMKDFNADNAKIASALADLEARVRVLDRVVPNIFYYVGQLSLLDFQDRRKVLPPLAMYCWDFPAKRSEILTGGADIKNGQLVLEGVGAKGSMTTSHNIRQSGWSTIQLCTHHTTGDLSVSLNDVEMEKTYDNFASSVSGVDGTEQFFTAHNDGTDTVQLTFNMDCGSKPSMAVIDYCLMVY